MKPGRFSSLAAFLEYRSALRRTASPSDEERATLTAIEQLLAILTPDERASLDDSSGVAAARRAERARRKLGRELAARGLLEA
ncbi:MAG TPA: hypothetical protein VMV15_13660 [Candidatus Binataceae bacterium]|nr:hypothetical protein [Candidatus Binataceae bacterium]